MRKGPPAPPRRGVDGILETLGGGARMGASRGAGREHPRRGEASQPLFVPELWLRTAVSRETGHGLRGVDPWACEFCLCVFL